MNSECQAGQGGANSNFKPSARKSIHDNSTNAMGRYGMNNSQNKNIRGQSPSKDEQGTDEVDNIQSKMQQQISPLPIGITRTQRRHSCSLDEENHSDDTTSMLSKSLPTTLPSRLYYSDDSDQDDLSAVSNLAFEESHHSGVMNWSNHSYRHETIPSPQRKLSVASPFKRTKKQSNSNSYVYIIIAIIIGVIAMIYVKYPTLLQSQQHGRHDQTTQTNDYKDIQFENNMKNLQEKYNIDHDLILKLKSGISTIFSRMDVGSFIFVYNSETAHFNSLQFDKFINEVAHTAARYLRHHMSSIEHTVLSSNLDMQEHGELIREYRDAVDKSGVLLVKEVDSVPSDLAMAFHYYCDEYDPLVKRSAIFFTLDLSNCTNSGEKKSTHAFIEKCLAGKWNTVPQENMRPLLTRVVNVIIDVTSVF